MAESNSSSQHDLLSSPTDGDEPSVAVETGAESLDRGESSSASGLPDQALDGSGDGTGASVHSEALGRGISTLMTGAIRDFDSKAVETSTSQDQLSSALGRLTRGFRKGAIDSQRTELDQLLEDAPVPFIMQHSARISGVRKRVSSLNMVLKSVQRRLDNIDRMLTVGSPHRHEKSSTRGSKLS